MQTILVVDDMAIFREPIAASLRLAGYATVCAANGKEALDAVARQRPDLILLDLTMPVMDGLTFLRHLRGNPSTSALPVILLTGVADRYHVVQVGKLGVQEYLLKSRFSLKELLERVKKWIAPGAVAAAKAQQKLLDGEATATTVPTAAPKPAAPVAAAAPAAPAAPREPVHVPVLLDRRECIRRAEEAMAAKTLSGVVAQVVSIAASPRGEMSQLAGLIARDPMLSARVLQAANSAAYASKRGVVTTIADAVRHIGCATVRNIAATLGIFDAMPSRGPDGFDPIRCWQHSFAVAQLCERLVSLNNPGGEQAGAAYLAGLCHDLGEILFRTHFAKEYAMVLDVARRSGRPREEVERVMLGMAHGELVMTILKCLSLPETILGPIGALHASPAARKNETPSPLARALRIAEAYANGLMLASSVASPLAPVAQADCRAATGEPNPPRPDALMFRSEVLTLTAMLARVSAAEEAALLAPMYPRRELRLWLARDPALSAFDPIEAALATLADVDVHDALPGDADLSDHRAVVAVARSSALRGFTADEVHAAAARTRSGQRLPCLLLVGRLDAAPAADLSPTLYPLPMKDLAAFVQSVGTHEASDHVHAVAA